MEVLNMSVDVMTRFIPLLSDYSDYLFGKRGSPSGLNFEERIVHVLAHEMLSPKCKPRSVLVDLAGAKINMVFGNPGLSVLYVAILSKSIANIDLVLSSDHQVHDFEAHFLSGYDPTKLGLADNLIDATDPVDFAYNFATPRIARYVFCRFMAGDFGEITPPCMNSMALATRDLDCYKMLHPPLMPDLHAHAIAYGAPDILNHLLETGQADRPVRVPRPGGFFQIMSPLMYSAVAMKESHSPVGPNSKAPLNRIECRHAKCVLSLLLHSDPLYHHKNAGFTIFDVDVVVNHRAIRPKLVEHFSNIMGRLIHLFVRMRRPLGDILSHATLYMSKIGMDPSTHDDMKRKIVKGGLYCLKHLDTPGPKTIDVIKLAHD